MLILLYEYLVLVNQLVVSLLIQLIVIIMNCNILEGIDYNSGPYTVIIPANVDEVSFSILITNDNKKEKNETFHLVIDSSSLPDGVVVDTPSQAIITIVDVTKRKILLAIDLCKIIVQ